MKKSTTYYHGLSGIALTVRKIQFNLSLALIYLGVKKSEEEKEFLFKQFHTQRKERLNKRTNTDEIKQKWSEIKNKGIGHAN